MDKQQKRNRILCAVFAVLFFLALVLIWPLWALLQGGLDTATHENRQLADFPAPGQTTISAWPHQFEDWLSDHAPFRNQWLQLNTEVNHRLFGSLDSEVVLLGQEGWMFLQNDAVSASIDDYQGINLYSEEELRQLADQLRALEEALAQKGTRLALLMVPNKEVVYDRYMPGNLPVVNEQGRADVLADYLRAHTDVPVLWPKEELRSLSQTQPVYYKYDTHWNRAGAAYTSALLLQTLGVEGPAPGALQYQTSDIPPLIDLANLAAAWQMATDDVSWQVQSWMPEVAVEKTYSDENLFYESYTSTSGNDQRLLMFRDSFGASMQEQLAAGFAHSSFVHTNAFTADTFANEQPDVFVIEIAQRSLDNLFTFLPRFTEWARA